MVDKAKRMYLNFTYYLSNNSQFLFYIIEFTKIHRLTFALLYDL